MNSREKLREEILEKAVVHGKVILSSGKEAQRSPDDGVIPFSDIKDDGVIFSWFGYVDVRTFLSAYDNAETVARKYIDQLKQNFNNSITKYKDPLTYNSFASTPELSIVEKKSNGFTTKVGNTFLCDYTEAFSHNDSLNFTLETVNINKDTLNNTDLTSAYEKLLAERNEFERHSRMTHLDMVDQNKNIQIIKYSKQ